MKVFTIDPGRFDPLTAYAAVNTLRLDDMNPHIFRTHDGGNTWKEIVSGMPAGAAVSVVREDPRRKGLLFAGSETQVYVSFDDGDHWQSLRLNMAPSSVRDLIVKQDPRVKTPALAMQQIYTLSKATYYGALDAQHAAEQARGLRDQIANVRQQATGAVADALAALDRKVEALEPPAAPSAGGSGGRGGRAGPSTASGQAGRGGRGASPAPPADTLSGASALLAGVMNLLQRADVRLTTVQLTAIASARATASRVMARWIAIKTVDVVGLNAQLRAAGLPLVAVAP